MAEQDASPIDKDIEPGGGKFRPKPEPQESE